MASSSLVLLFSISVLLLHGIATTGVVDGQWAKQSLISAPRSLLQTEDAGGHDHDHDHDHDHGAEEKPKPEEKEEEEHDHDHDHDHGAEEKPKPEEKDEEEHDHDHDHGNENKRKRGRLADEDEDGFYDGVHIHSDDETASEHLIEVFGGKGQMFETELDTLIHQLIEGSCGKEDKHDHGHSHAHGHDVAPEELSSAMLMASFGSNGILGPETLMEACPEILRCQLEEGCQLVTNAEDKGDKDDDNELRTLKILSGAVFLVEAIAGALIPMVIGHFEKMKKWMLYLNCFSGGVFITTGLLHMIPHLLEYEAEVSGLDDYPLGSLMVIIGLLLVLFVEHVVLNVHSAMDAAFKPKHLPEPKKMESPKNGKPLSGLHEQAARSAELPPPPKEMEWRLYADMAFILFAISVHGILEALALGLEDDRKGVLVLFASIGSHKGIAAMALSVRFIQNGATVYQVVVFMFAFALVAPIGILIGCLAGGVGPLASLIILGLSAGSFLYIGFLEIVAEVFLGNHDGLKLGDSERLVSLKKFGALMVGIILIALLQILPQH